MTETIRNRLSGRSTVTRLAGSLIAAGLATGCVHAPSLSHDAIARDVERDAIALNEAHTRTINAVIALNVLRARDNLPTGYTTLSGITLSPALSARTELGLAPLGLGNAASPFAGSDAAFSSSRSADARYSVNPVAEQASGLGLYKIEASQDLFQRYVESGWPLEVIVPLFVRRAAAAGATHATPCEFYGDHTFAFQMKQIMSGDPAAAVIERGPCAKIIERIFLWRGPAPGVLHSDWFYGDARDFLCREDGRCEKRETVVASSGACEALSDDFERLLLSRAHEPLDKVLAALQSGTGKVARLTADGISLCQEPASERTLFETGSDGSVWKVFDAHDFRSFNDMVYFLGETIREGGSLPVGFCGEPVALFHISSSPDRRGGQALRVDHAGKTYTALSDTASASGCITDRTGTVLTVLSQILLLNQSAEFLEAPRSILER
jgi:hypothetical protein